MLDRLPFLQPEGSNFRPGPLKKIRGRIFLGSGVEFWLFRSARHGLFVTTIRISETNGTSPTYLHAGNQQKYWYN